MSKRFIEFLRANYQWTAAISITLVGGFLRFYKLGDSSLYHDEALYWQWAVGLSKGEGFNVVINNNVFLFLLSKVVALSQSEFSLRFVSALASTLSIPAFFVFLRKLLNPFGALTAAGLLAFSPSLIEIAQTVREHSLFLLFVILLMYLFHRYLTENQVIFLVGFTAFSLLAIFTHISAAWVFMALGTTYVSTIVSDKKKRIPKQIVGFSLYGLIILFAGLLFWRSGFSNLAGHELEGYTAYGYYWNGTIASFLQVVFANTWVLLEWATNDATVIVLVLSLSLAFYWGFKKNEKNKTLFLISLLPLLITIITGLVSFYPFIGGHRNNIYLVLGVFSIAGLGFSYLANKSKIIFFFTTSLLALFLIASSWVGVHQPSLEEIRPVVQELCSQIQSGDNVYVFGGSRPAFEYYWPQCDTSDNALNIYFDIPADPLEEGIETNVWLVLSHLKDSELNRLLQQVEQAFDREFRLILEANGAWLYLMRD